MRLDWASDCLVVSPVNGCWLPREHKQERLGSLTAEPCDHPSGTSSSFYLLKEVMHGTQTQGGKGKQAGIPGSLVNWKHQSNILPQ